ncbi:MAG: insulinase family protein [Ignavibacteria bacterium]|nr:insulinase family protein [Ignavibacteria bacterium]MBI3766108.1 insulinase family protein [Ignavibacteriales bacterium]
MKILSILFTLVLMAMMGMTTTTLSKDQSGLTFTELPSKNSPLITFRVILRSGGINDPKGKEGLNALTAYMIAEGGTQDLTYSQVVDKLYPWAANISVQIDQEITTFVGDVHRDHLDEFYKLFSDLLLQPRFDQSDFSRLKDQGLNYIQNSLRATDDEGLGKQSLNAFLFNGHPYGKLEVGTVQGLTAITLDDVKQYYKEHYTQANLWIGITGGYPASLVDRMRKDFSSLPTGEVKEMALPQVAGIKGMEVMVVEKSARAYPVTMGYTLPITRKDKDFYALLVANSYFGEHRTFNGVLMNRLRGDRGLNYGDYSYVEKFVGGLGSGSVFPNLNTPLRQQFFTIWLRPVQPENTHFAIRNALFELKRLVENGLSKEDFEQTRKFVINYSKLWAGTMSRRLGYVMDSEFYGTDYFIDRIERELKALTVDDVNAAIKKYLHPSDIKITVVVDEDKGQQFLDALINNTPSPIKYGSPVSQNILDQDKRIEMFPLTVNKEKSKVMKVKELFEK